ncbi:MAG: IS66 family transposase [Endozoicomonas sp.]
MSQPAPEFQVIVTLLAIVNKQQEQTASLTKRVATLEAENKELTGKLNTNNRNSRGVVDRNSNYLTARLQRLLGLACHLSNGYRKIGMEAMPEVICQRIASLFERTAKRAQAEEAEYMERLRQRRGDGEVKNTKAFNLFRRLMEFREETLRFMTNLYTPFDNNGSEQDIRNGKVKQKISGCISIRSKKGTKWYCRIRSYVSSARKQGQSVFEDLFIAMKNYRDHPLRGAEQLRFIR